MHLIKCSKTIRMCVQEAGSIKTSYSGSIIKLFGLFLLFSLWKLFKSMITKYVLP